MHAEENKIAAWSPCAGSEPTPLVEVETSSGTDPKETPSMQGMEDPQDIDAMPRTQIAGESTEHYLRRRCEFIVHCINSRTWDKVDSRLISPGFVDTSERRNGVEKQTATQAMSYMMQHVIANPTYQITLRNTGIEVDEKKGVAQVFAQLGINDPKEGVELEGLSILNFRRTKDRSWQLTKHHGMRGVAPMPM